MSLGCSVDPYELTFRRDGGVFVDGGPISSADARAGVDARPGPDAAPDGGIISGCVPSPESCNGLDDDCDRVIDDGFDLTQDPRHCGQCGRACNRTNSVGTCNTGECSFGCLPGF